MSVTAVITCYNLERYIGAAIDSAMAAMDGLDGEIIVVDDCSTDGSSEIIRSRPVRYVGTGSNGGVMLATLAGIEAARHPIIAFLDGDDIWQDSKLHAVMDAFARDPKVALVTHDLDFIDSAGARVERSSRPSQTMTRTSGDRWSEHLRRSILEQCDDVWLGSALSIHKERARLDGFAAWVRKRPDIADLYQDWPLAAWIASRPECRLAYIPQRLFSYRLHGSNHSGDASTGDRALRNFRRSRNTLRAMVEIISRNGPPSAKLRRRLALAEAQSALYEGSLGKASRYYAAALPELARHPTALVKEAVRLAVIGLFGQARGQKLLKRVAHA